MEKEEQILKKRIMDLATRSYQENRYIYSQFLSLEQQNTLHVMEREIAFCPHSLFGGNEYCERKVVQFGSIDTLGYEEEFPIDCIFVEPLIEKFADTLTHRDFLGALMNLGIERVTIGDILIEGKTAYVFCLKHITSFIIEELNQVKHTHVKCKKVEQINQIRNKEPKRISIIVNSLRIDAIVSKIYNISRNQSLELFRARKVFVDGIVQENNSYLLKENESVTVRGYGKFIFCGIKYETKKERICIELNQFV